MTAPQLAVPAAQDDGPLAEAPEAVPYTMLPAAVWPVLPRVQVIVAAEVVGDELLQPDSVSADEV